MRKRGGSCLCGAQRRGDAHAPRWPEGAAREQEASIPTRDPDGRWQENGCGTSMVCRKYLEVLFGHGRAMSLLSPPTYVDEESMTVVTSHCSHRRER
jgi:hypothetical protein